MQQTGAQDPATLLARFPEGWSRASYAGRAWGVSRTSGVAGRVSRVYAEVLAGRAPQDPGGAPRVVSANLYRVGERTELRPCEMPAEVVLDFLERAVPEGSPPGVARGEVG